VVKNWLPLETYSDGSLPEEWGLFVEWLETRGPDEWHGFVSEWNWDYGSRIVMSVLRQESCDRATAILAFFRNGSDDVFTDKKTYDIYHTPERNERVRFGLEVLGRWRTGFYFRSEIMLNEKDQRYVRDSRHRFDLNTERFEFPDLVWKLPTDFIPTETGRIVPGYFAWDIATDEAMDDYERRHG
jgi:hypothetical protein